MSEDDFSARARGRLRRGLGSALREELAQMLAELEEVRRREPAPLEVEQLLDTVRQALITIDRLDG